MRYRCENHTVRVATAGGTAAARCAGYIPEASVIIERVSSDAMIAVAEVTGEHVQFRRPGPDNPRRPRVLVQDGTVHQFRRGQAHKTELQPDTPIPAIGYGVVG